MGGVLNFAEHLPSEFPHLCKEFNLPRGFKNEGPFFLKVVRKSLKRPKNGIGI